MSAGRIISALLGLALLAACSPDPVPRRDAAPGRGATIAPSSQPNDVAERKGSDRASRRAKDEEPGSQPTRDESPNTSKDRPAEGRSRSGATTLALPAPGSYSYVQDGWEEFCQAGNCDRRDLPAQEQMRIAYRKRSARRATFVSSTGSSGSESQEITYSVTHRRAQILRAENHVSYQGFDYTTRLVPDPPIVSARFPLEVGERWSGRWNDEGNLGDGSYRVRVLRRETISVRRQNEQVYVVDVSLQIEGENEGINELRVWVDPEDLTVLASKGRVEVTSSFGTYRSEFSTSYASGP